MIKALVKLYDWFQTHKLCLWLVLACTTLLMGFFAWKVDYVEDITSIFPREEKQNGGSEAFEDLKAADKLVFMLSGSEDPYALIDAGYTLADQLQELCDDGMISGYMDCVDASTVNRSADFIYDNLPIYLEEKDYARIDSLLLSQNIDAAVDNCFDVISSPAGMLVGRIMLKDPLGIGTPMMQGFQDFDGNSRYEIFSDHIFSADMSTMLIFADPSSSMGSTGANDLLTERVEEACRKVSQECDVEVDYFAGPCVAAYNARVVKHDTILTVSIALTVIILVILLCFRSKAAVPLLVLPTIYGALFALALIYFIQGSISAIAVGAGAAVMGVALSYSIHVISHSNHTGDPHRIIEDLAYPLTLGSFTTIAAFAALIFTHSPLLQDFGLFASLTLVGTTIFCLVFLPHFLRSENNTTGRKALKWIEKTLAYPLDEKKWFMAALGILTIVCCFFCTKVGFDSDMNHLCYYPEHLKASEEKLLSISGDSDNQTFLVTRSSSMDEACAKYDRMQPVIDSLMDEGAISAYVTARTFLIPSKIQKERIEQWNSFWDGKRESTMSALKKSAVRKGFKEDAFNAFEDILSKEYDICTYDSDMLADMPLLADWTENEEGKSVIVSRMTIEGDKGDIYKAISKTGAAAIGDRGYFTNEMVAGINDDFNYILLVSSLIVFLALLVSYGKLEYAILAFLPMAIGWIIILGLMAIFDIEFNIVSIILATFIFGIGDDFSIFIMDGLMNRYKDGSDILSSHKTAIFFSAFTTLVGIGVLVLAQHPAMRSMATISVLGILTVLIVEFTVQPFLFRLLVTKPVNKGVYPVDLVSMLNGLEIWSILGTMIILCDLLAFLLYLIPGPDKWKKTFYHGLLYRFCKFYRDYLTPGEKFIRIGYNPHLLDKPAVIIANHQSLVDVILLYALSPKIVAVTKGNFWHSIFLGPLIRYSDCVSVDDSENMTEVLVEKIKEGYSIVIFPEGTRSADGKLHRFHKGAFKLAADYGLELLPVVYYGNRYVCVKHQAFFCQPSLSVQRFYPRVHGRDERFGSTDRERAKAWKLWYMQECEAMEAEFSHACNIEHRRLLLSNYLYKGADVWARAKRNCRRNMFWDSLEKQIPRDAKVVELGCGIGERTILLGMLSRNRTVVGVDSSEEDIRIASNCHLAKDNIRFVCCEPQKWELEEADVYLIDSIYKDDKDLEERCKACLRPGGKILYI